ncbi:unnamed protein product [Rhizoctonia solani]|uniref:HNH nuclease domain-containing protein n=1 Tax=Rhizoctonia solani TaxID=456999 RepID=A0A8H3BJI2_9AGAM|nr:unnamed protein product [Rhizoctonia solani]
MDQTYSILTRPETTPHSDTGVGEAEGKSHVELESSAQFPVANTGKLHTVTQRHRAETLASAIIVVNDYTPQNPQDITNSFLLALLNNAPTERGQRNICRRVLECEEAGNKRHVAEKLRSLAEWYMFGLLLPIKVLGVRTPKTSEPPPGQESKDQETSLDRLIPQGEVAVRKHDVKKAALRRDNYRSALSGLVDEQSCRSCLVHDLDKLGTVPTEVAYILPFSLGDCDKQALVWTVLESFCGYDVASLLSGQKIHRLENILTLCMPEHWAFRGLTGWLEAVPVCSFCIIE